MSQFGTAPRLTVCLAEARVRGWNEQCEAAFVVGTKKPVQTGRCAVAFLKGELVLIKAPAGVQRKTFSSQTLTLHSEFLTTDQT